MLETLRQRRAAQIHHKSSYGDVREPIASTFNGFQLAAVGKKLLWSKQWKVFPDFLNQYLHSLLNYSWGSREVKLPFEQQHPIVQWRTTFTTVQQSHTPDASGMYTATTGAALAWFRLAYDLYLLEHNAHLQNRLIRRLRDPNLFQGARFEAAVAAIMLAAGYDLDFVDDRLPGKHPEFVAVGKGHAYRLAVEAKSRHRPGVLGHPGQRCFDIDTFDILGLLVAAAKKDPEEPLLIFVELNSPETPDNQGTEGFYSKLNAHWLQAQSLPWPKGFPAVGVVFYNDPSPWYLERLPESGSVGPFALALWPEQSRHAFDARPLLQTVLHAVGQRLNIPRDFPSR